VGVTSPPATVVTGAGSGIGRAVAVELAAAGHRLVLAGRRADALDETAALCAGDPIAVPTDVRDPAAVDALFAATLDAFGRVDLLFNNAGVTGPAGTPDEVDPEAWADAIQTNLVGSFLCARAAFAAMRAQDPQGGRIINNGSVSARRPRPRSVAYTASKHAVTGISRSIALDGRPFGITGTQIDIGNAETELLSGIGAGTGAAQADGTVRPEPVFPPEHAARMVVDVAELPPTTAVHELVITATGMPYDGRG
jgi:NAD(P)-dependent dehydrogenase (short-subunit alcohol dehydrogenase family)